MTKKITEKKEPKRKPKYSMLSCVGYIYRLLWRTERGLALTGIITVPLSLILSALALYTPSVVLRALETADGFSYIALVILGLMLAKLMFGLAQNVITNKIATSEFSVLAQMDYLWEEHLRRRDWYLKYDPEVIKMDERANAAVQNNYAAGPHFPMDFAGMLAEILNFLLFSSVLSLLNPLIVVMLAAICAVNYAMGAWERKKNRDGRDVRNRINKKLEYVTFWLSDDFKYAKDIRLYNMKDSLHERFMLLLGSARREKEKMERRGIMAAFVGFLTVFLRDGAAYMFLIYKAVRGEVDAASFVLYFSAVASMSEVLGKILSTVNRVFEGAMQVSDYREALEIKGELNHGEGIPVPDKPFSIEFKHVSYRYPEGEKKILDDVSFKIEAGEKAALVGANGAGKTTLTMLMCGMLLPDEGEILLDGHALCEYNRDEIYALFGFVPQSFSLLPLSIAKNIASAAEDEEIDRERLAHCIKLAGLTQKIASLPNGADTPLNREVNKDGVELSGGETQRLLLARLLYKAPRCIVLDEPTAALDPLAEDRIYRQYNEIASNATSIFVSHRLASTRFCDRIFLLDGARLAETGTHGELMAAGGIYREMFDVQSKYYKEVDKGA